MEAHFCFRVKKTCNCKITFHDKKVKKVSFITLSFITVMKNSLKDNTKS